MAMIEEQLLKLQAGLEELKAEVRKIAEISDSAHNKRPLTVPEIAKYLRLGVSTTYRKLEEGIIPGNKVGGRWYSFEQELQEFLQARRGTSKEVLESRATQHVVFGSIGGSRPFQRSVGSYKGSPMDGRKSGRTQ